MKKLISLVEVPNESNPFEYLSLLIIWLGDHFPIDIEKWNYELIVDEKSEGKHI